MKNFLKLIIVLASVLAFGFTANAPQEDKISGIYVDGVKVTEIDCYSFGEMEVIFPIDKLKGFDAINIGIGISTTGSGYQIDASKEISIASLEFNSFKYNGQLYTKYKIFKKDFKNSELYFGTYQVLTRTEFYVKSSSKSKNSCKIYIDPLTITGYEE